MKLKTQVSHQFNFQTNTVQSTPVEEVNTEQKLNIYDFIDKKVNKDEEGRGEQRWKIYDFNDKSEQLNDGKVTNEGLISMMTKCQASYS